MNISTLLNRNTKKEGESSIPRQNPRHFNNMNYNQGYGGGPPGYGPPHHHHQPPYYDPTYQNYDPYNQPPGPDGYHYPPNQEGGYPPPYASYPPENYHPVEEQPQFIRRDPHGAPQEQPPQQLQPQYSRSSQPISHFPDERVLRNPHPHIPLGSTREESYDPSLPTYNATPIYQPQFPPSSSQKTPIVAPTLSSIFEIASKKMEQQQQLQYEEKRASSGMVGTTSLSARGENDNALQFSSVSSGQDDAARIEIITGLVTQMQDMFGMVSSEIFFQTSTVVGPMPIVGDKVVVEAERVSGMPFKFNGKRVQLLSKDLTSNSAGTGTGGDGSGLEFERRRDHPNRSSLDFGPLPDMPNSLNLGPKLVSHPDSTPPLKSILKRNPPPPPMLSDRAKSFQQDAKYRPESPIVEQYTGQGYNSQHREHDRAGYIPANGGGGVCAPNIAPLFSLDLRNDFPLIKTNVKPLIPIQELYPELLYDKNRASDVSPAVPPQTDIRPREESSRRRERSRSPKMDRKSHVTRSRSRTKTPPRRKRPLSKSPPPLVERTRSRRSRSPVASRTDRSRGTRSSRSPSGKVRINRRSKSRSPQPSSSRGTRSSRSPSGKVRINRRPRSRSPQSSQTRKRGRSSSPHRRKKSRTPPIIKKSKDSRATISSRRTTTTSEPSEDDVQILNEGHRSQGGTDKDKEDEPQLGLNPFGNDSEIKAVVMSSTLFPRIPKKIPHQNKNKRFAGRNTNDHESPVANDKRSATSTATKPGGGVIPIKFQIGGNNPQPPAPKIVPNPAFHSLIRPSGPITGTLLENPIYSTNPSAVVASVERAIVKAAKKKLAAKKLEDDQGPAYIIMNQQKINKPPSLRPETREEEQIRRINELKNSLHAQKMAQIQEQERFLLEQKEALEVEINKNRMTEQVTSKREELKKTVENKLKGLRENFDATMGGGGKNNNGGAPQQPQESSGEIKSQEEMDKIREAVAYTKFLEEERHLKTAGNTIALAELYKREDRRRRGVEEDRLERLRLEEMTLKKGQNWEALKSLRETYGGTAERESELMRLREMREMEQDEIEIRRRAHERLQRGTEGPVKRLVMDTQMRQLAAANITVGGGEMRDARSPSPLPSRHRSRSPRRPSHSRRRSRSPRHSRSRREERSRSKGKVSRRSRSPSPSRRQDTPRHREQDRPRRNDMEEAAMLARMEQMHRQEQDLLMREREIHERMQFMQQSGVGQQYYEGGHPSQEMEMMRHDHFDPGPEAVYFVRS